MEKAKYSPSTRGIYPAKVYKQFPSDALDIPDGLYAQYQSGGIAGFDVVAGVVVASTSVEITLGQLKDEKNADINAWRDQQENAPILFEHAGRTWDGGLATRRRLDPVASLPALPAGFFWTDAHNNDVEMTLADIQTLRAAHEAAIVEQGFRIHIRQRTMKQEIEALAAANDAAGIAAYVIDWPAQNAGADDE